MSLIRQDPTTREWVIVATDRAKRPHEFGDAAARRPVAAWEAACPFCPGNESQTPDEILRIPDSANAWMVRVVPNKYAALRADGRAHRTNASGLFREMDGIGHHEVVIETPAHNRRMAQMADGEVLHVLRACQDRERALRDDPRVAFIVLFKNHGARAGTSLEHPHSQIVATPVAPPQVRRKCEIAAEHYGETGRCLYCDLVEAEIGARVRVVLETPGFVVFHPFASMVPFETWILPKHHQPSFGAASADDLSGLARVLRATLAALREALGDPDFNYIIHTAPKGDELQPHHQWHVQILPRVTTIAGFELGSGIYITTLRPEESAAFMRDALWRVAPPGADGWR